MSKSISEIGLSAPARALEKIASRTAWKFCFLIFLHNMIVSSFSAGKAGEFLVHTNLTTRRNETLNSDMFYKTMILYIKKCILSIALKK